MVAYTVTMTVTIASETIELGGYRLGYLAVGYLVSHSGQGA